MSNSVRKFNELHRFCEFFVGKFLLAATLQLFKIIMRIKIFFNGILSLKLFRSKYKSMPNTQEWLTFHFMHFCFQLVDLAWVVSIFSRKFLRYFWSNCIPRVSPFRMSLHRARYRLDNVILSNGLIDTILV